MKNVIVIKYGGSLMDDRNAEKAVLKNILSISKKNPVIVVHGGGKDITSALKKANIETKFINGFRYTDEKAIKIVEGVLENIQRRIAKELKNAVVIKKAVIGKRLKELGYVGKFTNAEISKINEVLNKKKIAVISPVGKSKDGQILNFNADDIAGCIAAIYKAKKLIFFTDVEGVLNSNKKTIPQIKTPDIKKLIYSGVITGGMIPKVQGCAEAVQNGVKEVDIFSIKLKGTKII
ncbi:MAG: acetylglutamate kinase [Elusimicrobia bacterium RIFOXYD2_FULL_34_15]|nr:MAG: acetylglutamate kinase [Elusimicrobia bacterium RIFOXYD2_FULL_34_15]